MKNLQSALTSFQSGRFKGLAFSLVAVLTMILLSSVLTGLELMPGEPEAFSFVFQAIKPRDPGIVVDDNMLNIIRIFYLIGLVLLPFWLVYIIVNPQARKRFIRDLVMFGSFVFMILTLTTYLNERLREEGEETLGEIGGLPDAPMGNVNANDFGSGPPEAMMWLASVLVALAVVGFLALAIWLGWRIRRQRDNTLELIAEDVQSALEELHSGGDLRNVVIRCYSDMVQALQEKRGVHRNSALTPREFEDTLKSLGFPTEPVHRLTSLFEAVRYGHKPITRREELVAIDSLTAILDVCRSGG